MKKQRFVVTIEMPDGDYISALYLQDLIQSDCDNIGDTYGNDIGRNKVSVTEEKDKWIEKACEWLKANIHDDLSIGTYVDTVETLVEDFCKALEGNE